MVLLLWRYCCMALLLHGAIAALHGCLVTSRLPCQVIPQTEFEFEISARNSSDSFTLYGSLQSAGLQPTRTAGQGPFCCLSLLFRCLYLTCTCVRALLCVLSLSLLLYLPVCICLCVSACVYLPVCVYLCVSLRVVGQPRVLS